MSTARPLYGSGSVPSSPSPPPEPTPRERIARFRSLAHRALAYWKVTAFILIAGSAIALYVAMHVKLIYRSESIILFKPSIRTTERADDESPTERAGTLAPKLKEVLTTRSRLEEMIKEYSLYPKTLESRGMLDAVDEMRSHVGFRGRDSETFVISYENEVPEVAQTVTQKLTDSMIAEFTKSSVGTAKQQADFLGAQEVRSEQELEAANKALATFLTMHPEFAVEAKGGSAFGPAQQPGGAAPSPITQHLANLPKDPAAMGDPQLAVLYRQRARIEAEMRNNAGGAPVVPSTSGGANAAQIAQLTVARDEAAKVAASTQSDLADKRTRLTDEHPDVIAAKTAAAAAARQLHQAEVNLAAAQAPASAANANVVPNVAGTNPELQHRLATLDAQIGARRAAFREQQKGPANADSTNAANATTEAGAPSVAAAAAVPVTNELVELETEWQRLLRVLHDVKIEHDDLKQKLERAKLASSAVEASGGDQMQILDAAYKPLRPSQGGRTKTAIMGGVAALLLALAYAFARVFFDDTIIDQADVEALHLIPVLGVLPKVKPGTTESMATTNDVDRKEASSAV